MTYIKILPPVVKSIADVICKALVNYLEDFINLDRGVKGGVHLMINFLQFFILGRKHRQHND